MHYYLWISCKVNQKTCSAPPRFKPLRVSWAEVRWRARCSWTSVVFSTIFAFPAHIVGCVLHTGLKLKVITSPALSLTNTHSSHQHCCEIQFNWPLVAHLYLQLMRAEPNFPRLCLRQNVNDIRSKTYKIIVTPKHISNWDIPPKVELHPLLPNAFFKYQKFFQFLPTLCTFSFCGWFF